MSSKIEKEKHHNQIKKKKVKRNKIIITITMIIFDHGNLT